MTVYEKMNAAGENMDVDVWAGLLHEDYTFVRNQSTTILPRGEWFAMAGGMFEAMKNKKMEFHSS